MTRSEHIKWCKDRAWKEYEFYKTRDGEQTARSNAIASMVSDLGKHDETRRSVQIAAMLMLTVTDRASLARFIDGFN